MVDFVKVRFKQSHFEFAYNAGDIGHVNSSNIPDPLSDDFIERIDDETGYVENNVIDTDNGIDMQKKVRYLIIGLILEGITILILASILIFK